jgi:hypothetical protein
LTSQSGGTRPDEVDPTPMVVSAAVLSGGIIESVPIGDNQRARGWLIDSARDFSPPEFDWFYVYVTTQATKFWSKGTLVLEAKEPALTIFPPGMEHVAKLAEPAFVFGVSNPAGELDPSAWPKTARVASIERALKKPGARRLRLVVGRKLKDEEDWQDRDWSLDEKGDVVTRQVLVNKRDLFELYVTNENASKSAHAHRRTSEAFACLSDIQLFWKGEREMFQAVKGPALVVVSTPVCHATAPSGTTYVLRVSNDGWGVDDDAAPCKISA